MRIIYKLGVELRDNTTFSYLFDNYETIEEGLEKRFGTVDKALDIRIGPLALCDICNEYKVVDSSKLMKKYGQITVLCEECYDSYKINTHRYIVRKKITI